MLVVEEPAFDGVRDLVYPLHERTVLPEHAFAIRACAVAEEVDNPINPVLDELAEFSVGLPFVPPALDCGFDDSSPLFADPLAYVTAKIFKELYSRLNQFQYAA